MSNTDRLIEIIEDHTNYEIALRAILEAADTHELPPYGVLPVFNDTIAQDAMFKALELITGKKYD